MATPVEIWGKSIVIRNCIIGQNLNLLQIRGYAGLDVLADISSADVYDQEANVLGTQRPLTPKHVKEAHAYAMESVGVTALDDPRAFTEVILNVRNLNVVTIKRDGIVVDVNDIDFDDSQTAVVDLVVDLEAFTFPPQEFKPDISRVDGNHRLSGVPLANSTKRDLQVDYPIVSFAIFMGLNLDQERKIFADINGNQKNMDTSHLKQIILRQRGDKAIFEKSSRAQWFAKKLSEKDSVFDGLVHMGGSKKGIRKKLAANPPLSFTGLVTMISHTLKSIDKDVESVMPLADCELALHGDAQAIEKVTQGSQMILKLLENYWLAVKQVFPKAWSDIKKDEYVLFESIGNLALSQLAGDIIEEQIREKKVKDKDFVDALNRIKNAGVTLKKSNFSGAAGLAGVAVVYASLIAAKNKGNNGLVSVMEDLLSPDASLLDD
jgi:DGQHR domain-containing protein